MGFVSGLELSRRFYEEVVAPLLAARFPGLRYAAALLGPGSEVLGFDTERSTDHDWGPRLQLFLDAGRHAGTARRSTPMLAERLPATFLGAIPTRSPVDRRTTGYGALRRTASRHGVIVTEPRRLARPRRSASTRAAGVTVLDWLATPTQRLAEVTGGAVFHDGPRRADRGPGAAGLVPRRRVALRAGLPVAAHRPGGAVRRPVRRGRRRARLRGRRRPAGPRPDAAVPADGTAATRRTASGWAPRSPGCPGPPAVAAALTRRARRDRRGPRGSSTCAARCEAVPRPAQRLGLTEPLDPRDPRRFYDRPFLVLDAARFAEALRHRSPTRGCAAACRSARSTSSSTAPTCRPVSPGRGRWWPRRCRSDRALGRSLNER